MKKIFINICILLSFLICSSLFSQTSSKLELTINDTTFVKKERCTDTLNNCWGYELGEEYYYIKYFNNVKRYDTIVVFFDEMKKDTMMFVAYHGYKKHSEKHWNKEGNLIEIHDSKLGINKAWYPNGQLRWDKVVTGRYYSSLDIDEMNKIWYSNGNIMYEYQNKGKDTIVELYHYKDGGIKRKNTYLLFEGKGDGYQYPEKYLDVSPYIEEYYCVNGQLTRKYTSFHTEKDYKTYYCNGNVKSYIELFYKQMRPTGKFVQYYENGNIKYKGRYKKYEDGEVGNVAIEVGEWITYDINGNVKKIESFDENGKLISVEE